MKTKIIPCICCEHEPSASDSVYYGMPQLKVTQGMDYFEIYCPNCGRGGMLQFKSAYLAVKDWNEMQESLRNNMFLFEEQEPKEEANEG